MAEAYRFGAALRRCSLRRLPKHSVTAQCGKADRDALEYVDAIQQRTGQRVYTAARCADSSVRCCGQSQQCSHAQLHVFGRAVPCTTGAVCHSVPSPNSLVGTIFDLTRSRLAFACECSKCCRKCRRDERMHRAANKRTLVVTPSSVHSTPTSCTPPPCARAQQAAQLS